MNGIKSSLAYGVYQSAVFWRKRPHDLRIVAILQSKADGYAITK